MSRQGPVAFRRADVDDAPSVALLHADSWRRHYRGAYADAFLDGDVEDDRLQLWTERLSHQAGGTSTILAEVGDRVVGFLHLVFDEDREFGTLIENLHVVFDRKRRGIGTELLARGGEAVVVRGPGGLHLWVLEQNTAAQSFYAARGGRCSGRRLVQPPGGLRERLNGAPVALRYSWTDPAALTI